MAKSKDMQWLPSGGVLVVAIGAGLVAAILVNVYSSVVRSEYEEGARPVLQVAEEVEKDTPLQPRHLKTVMLPKPFVSAMKEAIEEKDKDSTVLGKKAPRHMYPGEFLSYADFNPPPPRPEDIPRGFSLITIPLTGDTPGAQLRPGSYVAVYGDFNLSGDPRRPDIRVMRVIDNVRVKLIQGSAEALTEKSHAYSNISIQVRKEQALQLLQIQKALTSKSFHITLAHRPEGAESAEPEIGRQVLDLVEKGKPPAPGRVP